MAKSAMQMHARDAHRSETKPHQCQQCLKSFSSNHQLVQHIRVHTGEKPYRCSYCDRRFKQLSHVQQHTRLHTGKFNINLQKNILIIKKNRKTKSLLGNLIVLRYTALILLLIKKTVGNFFFRYANCT